MVGEDTTTNLLIYRICHFWGQQHISTWFALESISRGDKKRETAWQELPSHPCVANVKHLRWSRRGWGELTNVCAPCHLQPAQVSNLCCPYNPSRAKYHQLQTLSYKHQLHISMMYFIFEKFSYGCETVKQCRQGPRFSIRMIIWISLILYSLVMMSTSPVSTVIFPKSEKEVMSKTVLLSPLSGLKQ